MVSPSQPVVGSQRLLWMTIRQVLIILLGAVEVYLGLERSIVPRKKREQSLDKT